jgi:hypothetical protein
MFVSSCVSGCCDQRIHLIVDQDHTRGITEGTHRHIEFRHPPVKVAGTVRALMPCREICA